MSKIIISYRRADSDAITGRIRDRLAHRYGEDSVFMDIDNIPLGIDYRSQLREVLLKADVLLVVIGPNWRGPKGGQIRIQEETDPVRLEIETALSREIPTIPVLVSGASMPTPDELPDSLKRLSFHNAAEIDAGRDFHQHMDRLVRSVDGILKHQPTPEGLARRRALIAALAGGAAVLFVGGWAVVRYLQPSPSQQLAAVPSSPQAPAPVLPTAQAPLPLPQPQPQPQPQPPPQPVTPARYASAEEAASACESGSAPTFYADFQSPDSGWSGLGERANSNAFFKDGQLAIEPASAGERVVGHETVPFRNATLCVRVMSPIAQQNSEEGGGGAVFWSTDTASNPPTSFFALSVTAAGGFVLERFSGSSRYEIGSQKTFNGVNAGQGAVNLIRIAARANGNSAYVNGVKALDFSGQAEKDKPYVGLLGRSEKGQQNEWRFLDLVVVAPNFSDELTDFGVQPQTGLRRAGTLGSATPTTLPGAHVIRTGALNEALQSNNLDGARLLLIDALSDDHPKTIPGAIRIPYAGDSGAFTDESQRHLSAELKSRARGNLSMPIVFFCEGAQCWDSYNASLRAMKIGFTKVYWYRGGIFSWEQAGLPMK